MKELTSIITRELFCADLEEVVKARGTRLYRDALRQLLIDMNRYSFNYELKEDDVKNYPLIYEKVKKYGKIT